MKRNFVIIYTGREGSSPIVSILKKHPDVSVPLFEHLDEKNFTSGAKVSDLAAVMRHIFHSGQYDPEEGAGTASGSLQEGGTEKSVGFKWRPFEAPGVLEAMRENNVVIFMLLRRSVLQRAVSMYYTHEHLKQGHVQFRTLRMEESERAAYIKDLRNQKFAADLEKVGDLVEKTIISKRRQWRFICRPYLNKGGAVSVVFYEDFLEDPKRFINSILSSLGRPEFSSLPNIQYEKVNRSDIFEQVTNIDELLSDENISSQVVKYEELISKIMSRTADDPDFVGVA